MVKSRGFSWHHMLFRVEFKDLFYTFFLLLGNFFSETEVYIFRSDGLYNFISFVLQ